jgi:hypothetical protein
VLSIFQFQTAGEFLDEPICDPKGPHVAKRPKDLTPLDAGDLVVLFRRQTVFFVFENKIFHRGEHLAGKIENLRHGRDLPVEVPGVDPYKKGMRPKCISLLTGIDIHIDSLPREPEYGTLKRGVFCCVRKLQEMWDGKRELVEKLNLDLLEARGGDLMNKCFQVNVNTSVPDTAEVRECDGCDDGHMLSASW